MSLCGCLWLNKSLLGALSNQLGGQPSMICFIVYGKYLNYSALIVVLSLSFTRTHTCKLFCARELLRRLTPKESNQRKVPANVV